MLIHRGVCGFGKKPFCITVKRKKIVIQIKICIYNTLYVEIRTKLFITIYLKKNMVTVRSSPVILTLSHVFNNAKQVLKTLSLKA